MDAINTTESNAFNLDATLQGLILLKNNDKTLPFTKGMKRGRGDGVTEERGERRRGEEEERRGGEKSDEDK